MYPRAFDYHRANSLTEAISLLSQLGPESRVIAGGQSLIPLMKLRFASPAHLIDLNFIPKLAFVEQSAGTLRFGPLARHAQIADSDVISKVPILHDCAAGIADAQVRNQGTIGGSLAEADPSGDWGPVLMTLDAQLRCVGSKGERTIPAREFFVDAYTTALAHDELIKEISINLPGSASGGAYIASKRCPQVYAGASVAIQLTMEGGICREVAIALGAVGLTAIRPVEAEVELRGNALTEASIARAADAAMAAADPQPDMRGSADYKRVLVGALFREAINVAEQRSRGKIVEVSHHYA
jgi:aerobic carbon-monoxide dehydrogenase medium subunit